jgi:hypothetical protein
MLFRERSLRVKNRMRAIRSSGSVRGGAGNIPAYSAESGRDRPLRARRIVQLVVAAVGVGLQDPGEAIKMTGGMIVPAIARGVIETAPGPD